MFLYTIPHPVPLLAVAWYGTNYEHRKKVMDKEGNFYLLYKWQEEEPELRASRLVRGMRAAKVALDHRRWPLSTGGQQGYRITDNVNIANYTWPMLLSLSERHTVKQTNIKNTAALLIWWERFRCV